MSLANLDNLNVLRLLAMVFPKGAAADLGRRINHGYESAVNEGVKDSEFRKADQPQMVGQIRWGKINMMMGDFAESNKWSVDDVKMGKGHDNHVRITAVCFRITCHHVAQGKSRPANAKYLTDCYEMNDLLSQGDLFEKDENVSGHNLGGKINMQILHTANPENLSEVQDIDFVFANSVGFLAKFSITDLIACQAELSALPVEEMLIIKRQFKKFGINE